MVYVITAVYMILISRKTYTTNRIRYCLALSNSILTTSNEVTTISLVGRLYILQDQ